MSRRKRKDATCVFVCLYVMWVLHDDGEDDVIRQLAAVGLCLQHWNE